MGWINDNIKLESFLNGLCADDVNQVLSVLGLNGKNIITAKDSNHKIINRERKIISCPHCESTHTVKNGKTKTKRQKYMCMDCNKSFRTQLIQLFTNPNSLTRHG